MEDSAQRWEKGEGSLWRSPELEAGLAWRDRVQPTAAWASRYGQHFDSVRRFLEESASGQVRELQRVTQQKELAMQAINLLTYELVDELEPLPRTTPILVRVLEKNAALLEEIFALDPATTEAQREKSSNLTRLGDCWLKLGNTPAALVAYQKSLAIAETLAQADPSNTQAQRDLSFSYDNIGNVQVQQGNTPKAQVAYQKSLEIRETLAQADPSNTQAQRDLSISYNKLERVHERLGHSDEAKHSLQQAITLVQPLTVQDPQNQILQNDLAESQSVLARLQGDEQWRLQQPQAAVQSYQQALAISLRLAAVNQGDMDVQRDVYLHYQKLGDAYAALPDPHAAATAYQEALQQLETKWPMVTMAAAPALIRRDWEEIGGKLEGVRASSAEDRGWRG